MQEKTIKYSSAWIHLQELPEKNDRGVYILDTGNVFGLVINWLAKAEGNSAYLVKKADGVVFHPGTDSS